MQPEPQSYGQFPNTHGQTTSLFKDTGVQTQFAFIPDDGSATYIIDVTVWFCESLVKTKPHAFNRQIPPRLSKLRPTRTLKQPISPRQILWFRFRLPVQPLISASTHKT